MAQLNVFLCSFSHTLDAPTPYKKRKRSIVASIIILTVSMSKSECKQPQQTTNFNIQNFRNLPKSFEYLIKLRKIKSNKNLN